MKILQVNSVCGTGSTGRIATDIHQVLLEHGQDSYIAYGRSNPRSCDDAIRIGSTLDNYSHVALTRIFDRHGFGSSRVTHQFLKKVELLGPDIVHLHNIHGYYLNLEIFFEYLRATSKPVVWTLHDCWAFTGHCAYFDYVGCNRWKTACYECPQKKEYPASLFLDSSSDNFMRKKKAFTELRNMTIVTPSKWLAGLVKESFLAEYNVEVINNGVDLGMFCPSSSDFRLRNSLDGKYVILGVANVWDRRKGLEYFVELVDGLHADEKIVLVGLTDQQKEELPKGIVGVTRTESVQELAGIYSAADVFVNPTLEDNFPTTNLESLACGTPVITFETGGSVEAVDEHTGLVVRKGDAKGLLDAIRHFRGFDRHSLREACLKRSKELYDKNDRFVDYMNLYRSCIVA